MINELDLSGKNTFLSPMLVKSFKKVNFFYGSNGSGKTTISRVIKNRERIGWLDTINVDLVDIRVFNRDYIDENFGENSKINGIFNFGEDNVKIEEEINELTAEAAECLKKIGNFNKSKEELEKKRSELEESIKDLCWNSTREYTKSFNKVFAGFKRKEKFLEKCLEEVEKDNLSEINYDVLKELYTKVFEEEHQSYDTFKPIKIDVIKQFESCELLSQVISGSSETDIGKFITVLENSDWIKQGMIYVDKANDKCPFCRQKLPESVYTDIKAFFDKTYEDNLNQITAFYEEYTQKTAGLIDELQRYINRIPKLDYSLFEAKVNVLQAEINSNIDKIKDKLKSPSTKNKLEQLSPFCQQINEILGGFNEIISKNNEIVENLEAKKEECVKEIWQLAVSRLKDNINIYIKEKDDNEKGVINLTNNITEQEDLQRSRKQLIVKKQANLKSVKATIAKINTTLANFGFTGFSIRENLHEPKTYQIMRSNNEIITAKTLSEGERNFICFLYFYHSIYGSLDENSLNKPRIVVIDDPISSLDSNVLFIVSVLVKDIIKDCLSTNNKIDKDIDIKQVFILTHNVYFYKEITFLGNGKEYSPKDADFWLVKKNDNLSQVEHKEKNFIQTYYQLLWEELKEQKMIQNTAIFNTFRRVLEYYFKIMGGYKDNDFIGEFDGEDKMVCKSLIAWVKAGSHLPPDDMFMQHDSSEI
ncbi:MAG: AAA family ATPase, partial [Spirochaetaceae bacterium]|nr:AAA family ATPase [Spirochaetaceae bacterium]